MTDVAVLGTGIMGEPMARNIARAGHAVRAWNRTLDRARPLEADGVRVCETPAEAVDGADVVVTMLTDGNAVRAVMQDAIGAMKAGAVWWQSSTVGLADTEALAKLAGEHDVAFVDAPVLGTRQPAEAGQLVVMASGPAAAVERLQPVFDAVASRVLRLGNAGEGTRLKLVVNHWLAGVIEGLAETIALAEGIDLDPRRFLEAIAGGALDSGYAQTKGKAMIERHFPPSFPLRLARKDVGLVLQAASRQDVDLGLAPVIADRFDRAIAAGHRDDDIAAAIHGTVPE
jgi:3-hydroxyisobutyrate dehydrogenase